MKREEDVYEFVHRSYDAQLLQCARWSAFYIICGFLLIFFGFESTNKQNQRSICKKCCEKKKRPKRTEITRLLTNGSAVQMNNKQ